VTIGASGGVFAILMAFGMVFGENEIMMIPFPFLIKAKYFVLILIVVTVAFAIGDRGGVAYLAHLGGLFFGYLVCEVFAGAGNVWEVLVVGVVLRNEEFLLPLETPAGGEEV
jgi:membrane associated rhomboid family serine protease